ncbi:unnamed protein product [Adineta steineri]|uniref:Uncharacterized protein n=1 Tax=Adineta steineri TaxID=433720 RepID=A0A819IWT8_9BILA|nr:unnamed protein product [Adineta steineri]
MSNLNLNAVAAILCLETLCGCIRSTVGQYIYKYYLQMYSSSTTPMSFNSSSNSDVHNLSTINHDTNCRTNVHIVTSGAQTWAQQRSANLFFWIDLSNGIPIIIATYILGVYTPRLGIRLVATLPMSGLALQISIWLAIIYFHLSDYWWIIGSIIVGLSGSASVLIFVLHLIVTDCTTESERSSRFVLLGAITTGLSAVASFMIGYYIKWRGFTDLFWIALILQLLSIVVGLRFIKPSHFIVKNSAPLESRNPSLPSSTVWTEFFEVFTIFSFNRRPRKKSISLYLTLLSFALYTFTSSSMSVLLWYLLSAPFCWSSEEIGNYTALSSIASAILRLLGIEAFTKLGAGDPFICTISHILFSSSVIWMAFAQHNWAIYITLLITPFTTYQGSLTWSMISKWLEPHERSHAFTFVTETYVIMLAVGGSFFNWLYARTIVNHRSFTFVLAASLNVIPFILNIYLMLVTRKLAADDKITQLIETDSDITQLLEADSNMTQSFEENLNSMPLIETDVDTALSQSQLSRSDSLKVRFIHQSQTISL